MFKTVEQYLKALKKEMQGIDKATIQDALIDAEEHLRTALENNSEESNDDLISNIIEEYGTPQEVASAYAEVERLSTPAPSISENLKQQSVFGKLFSVYADPKAWGSLFYMFIAFATGIAYFTWVVTGVSLSVSLSIFIFGLPLAMLFILSIRGIAWIEGRLVEALLGVRMPRRPRNTPNEGKFLNRLLTLLKDKYTWFSMIYMVIQLGLGIIYFTITVTLFSVSLAITGIPILQEFFNQPVIMANNLQIWFPFWSYPLVILVGILLVTLTLHLIRGIGNLHGKYAKAMLVIAQE